MKLNFEYDLDKKKIIFHANGFEVSASAETYEEIAEFAKTVIEHDILVPGIKHEKE